MIRAATVHARLLLQPRSYASQVSMGKIHPHPWEHFIEHPPCAADVPLSVGRAGKGGVPLASRLQEAFASWVWAVWPRSICNFQSIMVTTDKSNAYPTSGYRY